MLKVNTFKERPVPPGPSGKTAGSEQDPSQLKLSVCKRKRPKGISALQNNNNNNLCDSRGGPRFLKLVANLAFRVSKDTEVTGSWSLPPQMFFYRCDKALFQDNLQKSLGGGWNLRFQKDQITIHITAGKVAAGRRA